jgi:hypothetical protein
VFENNAVKIIFFILLLTGNAYVYGGSGLVISRDKAGQAIAAKPFSDSFFLVPGTDKKPPATEPKISKLFSIGCTNAFEWMIACDLKKVTVGFAASGLGNDEWNSFLFDGDHLFYRPEVRNNEIDLGSHKRWELRFSLFFNLQNLIFIK